MKMAERGRWLPREPLQEYGKMLANLTRKACLNDAGEERKQVLRRLEDGLANPALSSLYLNPKGSIAAILDYL